MKKLLMVFAMAFFAMGSILAQRTITGMIADNAGDPLIGANVLVKGTSTGTVTDLDGKYSISVPEGGTTLIVSYTGYSTQELEIGASNVVDIVMTEGVTLSTAVVTALGITRDEASLGYAVQQVGADDIARSGSTNVLDALQGKTAGIQIINAGGQAGSGTSTVIRGYTSINGSNQALIVVDGVPIDNTFESEGIDGTIANNRAVDINPDDIESVSVLRGGAATALYGIRAGNGAIIITTKKGSKGTKGLNVEYGFSRSIDQVNKLPSTTSAFSRGRFGTYSNVTHWNWGRAYSTNPTFPDGTSTDLDGDGTVEDVSGQAIPQFSDNYGRFWQDGNTTRHNLSFSGGGETSTFYAAISRLDQTGIIPNQDYGRTSFLINGTQQLSDKVSISAKANYINTGGKRFRTNTGISEGLGYWHSMWDINGYPWKDANGDKTWFSNGVPHPQWIANEEGQDWKVNRLIGNIGLNWELTDWIGITYNVGIDTWEENRKEVRPIGSVNTASNMGDMAEDRLTNTDITSDLILRGKTNITEDLDVSFNVGHSFYRSEFNRLFVDGTTFILKDVFDISNTVTQTVTNRTGGRMLVGAFGDVTFGYKHFLYLGITGRNDWSSTLPVDNNSFFYPSVNLGFVFSEIVDVPWLSYGKFRASYAQSANDAPIQSLRDIFDKQDPNLFGQPRFTTSDLRRNPNLRPEGTSEVELGLDLRLFNNLLGVDLSVYKKNSTDQIIEQSISNANGFSSQLVNLGEVQNQGIEATISINNPIKVKDFNWTTSINFTRNVGEVIRIGESTDDDLSQIILNDGWWANAQLIAKEGEQYGTIYGYPYTRRVPDDVANQPNYDPSEDPNYLSYPLQVTDEGHPTQNATRYNLGNVFPDWILGLNTSLSYKNINFGFTVERKQGGKMINGTQANLVYAGLAAVTNERWYDDDDVTANARRNFGGVNAAGEAVDVGATLDNDFYASTWRRVDENLVQDASWWRLRNIYLGYSLPSSILGDSFIQGLDITISGRNVWLDTPYDGVDPENSAHGPGNTQGFDEGTIPNTKSWELGIRARF